MADGRTVVDSEAIPHNQHTSIKKLDLKINTEYDTIN